MYAASLPGHFITWLCSLESDFLKGKYVWANWDVNELLAMKERIEGTSLLTLSLDGWPFAQDT